jgi:glycosyltransferase involved in cell wall biosynthesis
MDCRSASGMKYRHRRLVLGVPVFNEGRFVEECLESIRCQADGDFLVLVSDNGSTDDTASKCARFARLDDRFVFIQHPANRGSLFNFEFVRRNSDSPFFAWIGGHDVLSPEYVATHIGVMEASRQIAASYTYFSYIDERGSSAGQMTPVGYSDIRGPAWWRLLWSITCSDVAPIHGVLRRSMLPSYKPEPVAGCDHILLSGICAAGAMVATDEQLYFRRMFAETHLSGYMERITGRPGVVHSRVGMCEEYERAINSLMVEGLISRRMASLACKIARAKLLSPKLPLWYRVPVSIGWRLRSMRSRLISSWW